MWTLVQKNVASLDQRFENAQDKLLESLYGTKKVLVSVCTTVTTRSTVCFHAGTAALTKLLYKYYAL